MRSLNFGNFLVGVGLLGLGFTLWWPYATAERVARIETWAELTGILLATVSQSPDPVDPTLPDGSARVLARLDNVEAHKRLTPVTPPAGVAAGAYFRDQHYHYAVLRTPPDMLPSEAGPTLEVWAWPSSYLEAGRTAFFFPTDDRAMYSRNLRCAYAGFTRYPEPGKARLRPDTSREGDGSYRGRDGERWLALPQR